MRKRILTLLFLAFCTLGRSQSNESIYPNFIGQNLKKVENNSNWKVLNKTSGDLNKDGYNDFALILESKDSLVEKRCSNCKLLKNKPRIIIVILNQNNHEKVIIQNNRFIARGDEGGMLPYLKPELAIQNGALKIYYQFTRSNQSYTFEFENNHMMITKAESNAVHSASGNYENDKYDFNKGEIISNTGNISQEKTEIKITKFDIKPKSLSEFEEMSEWEIIQYKYL